MKVKIQNGDIIELPDGLSTAQIAAEVDNYVASKSKPQQPAMTEKPEMSALGKIGNAINSFAGGFNYGVESRGRGLAQAGLQAVDALPFVNTQDAIANFALKQQKERQAYEQGAGQTTSGKIGAFAGDVAPLAIAAPISPAGFATAGAVGGAVDAATTPTEDPTQDLTGRAVNTAVGAAVGGLSGKVMEKVVGKLVKMPIKNADQLRKQAGEMYKAAEKQGGLYTEKFSDDFVTEAKKMLIPADEVVANMKSNRPLIDAFDEISAISGQPMTLDRAKAFDEQLGTMINQHTSDFGKLDNVGNALYKLQSKFRDMIENASDDVVLNKEGFKTLKEARKLWARSLRVAEIERIIEKAQFAEQPATAIKTGFKTLAFSDRFRGFSKAEQSAIKKAAKDGIIMDIIKPMGSRLIPIIGAASGGGLGTAATSAGASIAARSASAGGKIAAAEEIARMIANNKTLPNMPAPSFASGVAGTQSGDAILNYLGMKQR